MRAIYGTLSMQYMDDGECACVELNKECPLLVSHVHDASDPKLPCRTTLQNIRTRTKRARSYENGTWCSSFDFSLVRLNPSVANASAVFMMIPHNHFAKLRNLHSRSLPCTLRTGRGSRHCNLQRYCFGCRY